MSKSLYLGALVLMTVGLGTGRAQPDKIGYSPSPALAPTPTEVNVPLSSTTKPAPALSQWIVGTDPDCCGPLGNHTPLMTELYFRSGFSFPYENGQLGKSLNTGWDIEGGGRALCFNERGDAAWTLSMGVLNIHNDAEDNPPDIRLLNLKLPGTNQTTVTLPQLIAHVRSLNRTFLTGGVGREWYMLGAATGTRDNDCAKWRIGYDLGGRWGSAKVDLFETLHRTDVIGGAYVAIHSDIDIPCGCCTFFGGIRGEYSYTWSDILQIQNKAEFGEFGLLFSLGVRY